MRLSFTSGACRPSAQRIHVGVDAVEDGIVRTADGRFVALMEIGGATFGMRGPDEQEGTLAGYAAFLNSLDYPLQIVVRLVPADFQHYVERVEERARHALSGALAEAACDFALFLRRLGNVGNGQPFYERRFYLAVATSSPASTGASWFAGFATGTFGLVWRRRHGAAADEAAAARRQLAARCAEIARQLGRCELQLRRLNSAEAVQLYYACWNPDRSGGHQRRRLQQAVEASTAPAVLGTRTGWHAAGVAGVAGVAGSEGVGP